MLAAIPNGVALAVNTQGAFSFGEETTNVGADGFVIAALNVDGTPRWMKSTSGSTLQLHELATDDAGRFLVAGIFQDTLSLGDQTHETESLGDFFVAMLTTDGDYVWSRSFPCSGYGLSIAADFGPSDTIHLTGGCFGQTDFGQGALGEDEQSTGFYAVLNEEGMATSSTRFEQAHWTGDQIRVTEEGVFIAGRIWAPTDFGSGPLGTETASDSFSDAFVLRLDTAGQVRWARSYGALANDTIVDAFRGATRYWAVGDAAGDFDLGAGTRSLGERGGTFIVAMDDDGSHHAEQLWSHVVTGAAMPLDGGLAAAGWLLEDDVDLGQGPTGARGNLFIATLGEDAQTRCSRLYEVGGTGRPSAIAPGPDNTFFVAGTFEGRLAWEEGDAQSIGETDVFVTRVQCDAEADR